MYFPIGWPKVLTNCRDICQIACNRDRILFTLLSSDAISIWFCKPPVLLITYHRSKESIQEFGSNRFVEWRPDSSMIVVATTDGCLLFFKLEADNSIKTLYELLDSPNPGLRRESAELFIKEPLPAIKITLEKHVRIGSRITGIVCIRNELMIATANCHIVRYTWDGNKNRDYSLDLRRIPFCLDKQVSKAVPIFEENKYVVCINYSPLIGGFTVVFNDGKAAFLTASTLKFDPNQVQGIWAPNLDDVTCCAVNHRYRLTVFGRKNSGAVVYTIDDQTGGLEVSHNLIVSSQVYPGELGPVECIRWTPDGCALALAWQHGGFSIWSTFGALLCCSLAWNYGLNVDLNKHNPLRLSCMEWGVEGYQLWMINKRGDNDDGAVTRTNSVMQLEFLKSVLTVNPCMTHQAHLFLQGAEKLYVNLGTGGLTKVYHVSKDDNTSRDKVVVASTLVESKQWIVISLPSTYLSTNWPLRYSAIDTEGKYVAVAGRSGLAHYSMTSHRWKLFGNESQERDMVVSGGLLWWRSFIVAGCYSIPSDQYEIRIYERDARLSNEHMTSLIASSHVLLLDCSWDKLVVFCADGHISIYTMHLLHNNNKGEIYVELNCIQMIDISALCVHPACVISVTLTAVRSEPNINDSVRSIDFVLNLSGKLLLVNQEDSQSCKVIPAPILLASCVENVWVPNKYKKSKPHLTEALWLFCGAHGMRVWLPLFPKDGEKAHTFISKRIMLPFKLTIYPLAILFEDAILLGAENDTILYTSDADCIFSLPFNIIERTSQVYLHQILRQLIRRNLGFHAWEVARCCETLPYFPHSLELLLHEVLEEEATSKEPIPDAQLPSVVEFIQEFPNVYLQTVVQCARKTEIALWSYLFSAAGKPTDLFQKCLIQRQLNTAASYLIILQNLESSNVSRQYATLLLDATLENSKWDISKDLVRFFRAIDPNDRETSHTCRTAKLSVTSQTPTVQPNEEDLSFFFSSMQVTRGRTYSTATLPKLESVGGKSVAEQSNASLATVKRNKSVTKADKGTNEGPMEEFFLDVILQRHARKLLTQHNLSALGYFAAHLDFRLVEWLHKERETTGKLDNFVKAIKHLHTDFSWPLPVLSHSYNNHLVQRKISSSLSSMTPPVLEERSNQWPCRSTITNNADLNSAVGDSGYMSCQDAILQRPFEANLQPHIVADIRSVISEADETAWWAEEQEHCSNDSWNDIPSVHILEQLSNELTTRGSQKSEVQLRYLLQLFIEAGCLDWSMVISVLLRDVLAVHRVTNAARSPDQGYEAVVRLKEGFLSLFHWSHTECIGYKPLLIACQGQVNVLNKLLGMKEREGQSQGNNNSVITSSSPKVRSRTTSSTFECNSQSGASMNMNLNTNTGGHSVGDISTLLQDDVFESSDAKSDDAISVASHKSISSCVIS